MILGIDTSGKYLNLVLMDDFGVVETVHRECFKHQSEEILPEINRLLARNKLNHDDIDGLVITEGPGSYTGIRIGMTVAKIWAKTKNIPLYKLSTLQLIAGIEPNCVVYLDARANRGYFGVYSNGAKMTMEMIVTEAELKDFVSMHPIYEYRGDVEVLGHHDDMADIGKNFYALRDRWVKVNEVDALTPVYFKDANSYKVKKR